MPVWLIFAEFVLLLVFLKSRYSFKMSLLSTNCIMGVLVAVFTILLSLPKQLTRVNLSLLWTAAIIVTCFLIFKYPGRKKLKNQWKGVYIEFTSGLLFYAPLALIFLLALCAALTFPPVNWDSMTYHMPRVTHWIQNQSVAHYATNISRQIFSAPLAEYGILHILLLSGNDHLANLVQWFCYVSSAIALSAIAEELELPVYMQRLSALLYALLPMAILQAHTTQNDVVATFWTLFGVYLIIRFVKKKELTVSKQSVWEAVLLSFCVALGFMTKATSCLAMIPFIIYLFIDKVFIKRDKPAVLTLYGGIALSIFILFNSYVFVQNYDATKSILGTPDLPDVMVEEFYPPFLFLNAVKNTWMELDFDNTRNGVKTTEQLADKTVSALADVLKIDKNHEAISFMTIPFKLTTGMHHHDLSGNRWHVLFALVCIPIVIYGKCTRKISPFQFWFSLTAVASFFMIVSFIKWQPWITRLTSPGTALMVLIIPIAISILKPRRIIIGLIVLCCSVSSVAYLLCDTGQPLLLGLYRNTQKGTAIYKAINNKGFQYGIDCAYLSYLFQDEESLVYYNQYGIYVSYSTIISFIEGNGIGSVGLKTVGDSWEYPFWKYLSKHDVRIQHVMVENSTTKYLDSGFSPDCIVLQGGVHEPAENLVYNQNPYTYAYSFSDASFFYVIYVRDGFPLQSELYL